MSNWLQKAVIYHILIDRFAGYNDNCNDEKPEFCGGTLKGITEKLDFIRNLGINTILISPFTQTSAYHGYHITDYEKIDRHFGNSEDLSQLIEACHSRKMQILADFVPNHCSVRHPWFADVLNKGAQSEFFSWFYFDEKTGKYLSFLDFTDLPKLNLENSQTADYMLGVALHWASRGFDGFRIDHITGVPDNFLYTLSERLKKQNHGFVLIGEAWNAGLKYRQLKTLRMKGRYRLWEKGFKQLEIQNHYRGIIDGVFDFDWRNRLLNTFNKGMVKQTAYTSKKMEESGFALLRFLDNHDTNRIMFECRNEKQSFRNCLKTLLSQEKPVVLYMGTEFGITQSQTLSHTMSFSDLQVRKVMPWNSKPIYANYISKLLNKR